jgi:hypothetical protein
VDEPLVDDALNLDSSGTFELGKILVPAVTGEDDTVAPDFPALAHRRDPHHRELLSHVFDNPDFAC